MWWWWAWIVFIVVVLFLPLSFGWGRLGWGPPYPSYYRRRNYAGRAGGPLAAPDLADPSLDTGTVPPTGTRGLSDDQALAGGYPGHRWSWVADLFWLAVLGAIAWAVFLWVT